MDNSVTFMVNHEGMEKGLYLARVDKFRDTATVTIDIRIRRPYRDSCMTDSEMHTCEHSFATCVRDEAADNPNLKVLYYGPMGCATGFYLLLQFPAAAPEQEYFTAAYDLLKGACRRMEKMESVPASNRFQCGNYQTLSGMDSALLLMREIEAAADGACDRGGFCPYRRLTEEELKNLLAQG